MASAFIKFKVPEDSLKTIAAGKSRIPERSLLIERLLSDEWRLARNDKKLAKKTQGTKFYTDNLLVDVHPSRWERRRSANTTPFS